MINDQILDYIRHQLSQNASREAITANLKGAGWADTDIAEAFTAISPVNVSTPTPAPAFSPTTNLASPQMQSTYPTFPVGVGSKSKKIFSIVLVLLFLGVAGAGAYAYYSGMFVSLPSLTKQALEKIRTTTTGTYDMTVSVDFSEIKNVASLIPLPLTFNKFNLTVKGSYNLADSGNLKSSNVISIDAGPSSLAIEARILDNVMYASMVKAPTGMDLFSDISSYENKWISFPYNSKDGQMASNPLASFSGINSGLFDKLTPEQKEYVYDLSSKASFIKTVERLSPEKIGGELSYHFIFDLDREGIRSYLESIKEYMNEIGKNDSALSAFDPTSFSKELDKLKDFKGEIWIGRSNKLINKIVLNFGVQPDIAKPEQVKVTIVSIMSDWNQPVVIVAPTEHMTLKDLMAKLFSGSLLGGPIDAGSMDVARKEGKEAVIKSNLQNFRAQAELFYDDNAGYKNFCFSEEVKTASKKIKTDGGTNFFCSASKNAYAIGVKLPNNSGNWCVDSTGVNKATATLPTGTVCPLK